MTSKEFLDTIDIFSKFVPVAGSNKRITTAELKQKIANKYNHRRAVVEDPDLKGDVFRMMSTDQFEKYMLKRYKPYEE